MSVPETAVTCPTCKSDENRRTGGPWLGGGSWWITWRCVRCGTQHHVTTDSGSRCPMCDGTGRRESEWEPSLTVPCECGLDSGRNDCTRCGEAPGFLSPHNAPDETLCERCEAAHSGSDGATVRCKRCGGSPVVAEVEGRTLVCATCRDDAEFRAHAERDYR